MQMSMRSSTMASRTAGAPSTRSGVVVRAGNNWAPGSVKPAYLPADMPGNFGFDPLGLGKDAKTLERFQESEVIHGRWAMLGVAGSLAVELAGQGNWFDAPTWAVNGGSATYLGASVPVDLPTLIGVEVVAMAIAEGKRAEGDWTQRVYPGGAFDPMGMSKDSAVFASKKVKEIKNVRLAMVAFVGFIGQHAATGKSPLEALSGHVASPWAENFATNGVSIPGL